MVSCTIISLLKLGLTLRICFQGVVALIGNVICLLLINRHKDGEVHMRASWIFSKNDVVANVGVIVAGALVLWTGSRWPDLIIGLLIVGVVLRGAMKIVAEARREVIEQTAPSCCSTSSRVGK